MRLMRVANGAIEAINRKLNYLPADDSVGRCDELELGLVNGARRPASKEPAAGLHNRRVQPTLHR